MQGLTIEFSIFLIIIIGILAAALVTLILVVILHNMFCKKFDSTLFVEPFFLAPNLLCIHHDL